MIQWMLERNQERKLHTSHNSTFYQVQKQAKLIYLFKKIRTVLTFGEERTVNQRGHKVIQGANNLLVGG